MVSKRAKIITSLAIVIALLVGVGIYFGREYYYGQHETLVYNLEQVIADNYKDVERLVDLTTEFLGLRAQAKLIADAVHNVSKYTPVLDNSTHTEFWKITVCISQFDNT